MSDNDLLALAGAALAAGCAARPHMSPRESPRAVAAVTPQPLPPLSPELERHLLGRFTFGPSRAETGALRALGVERWFEQQLAPPPVREAEAAASAPYRSALGSPDDVVTAFSADMSSDPVDTESIPLRKQANRVNVKALLASVGAAQIARQLESDAQLHALMVDFWSNHFNVYARKNAVKVLAGNYVETAIAPYALGRFEDLLLATARHPAMLVYLDNDKSVADDDHPRRRRAEQKPKKKRGLNENYARELLELHTLGVDGGYTQGDVTEVARVLTGFGLCRAEEGLRYEFRADRHDSGSKTVLGKTFPPGGGEEEGLALWHLLATHPSTARHVASKLCRRFVSDTPPAECVARVAQTFSQSDGDIGLTLKAILHDPAFWAASARAAKLKKPSEFLLSALRALEGELEPSGEIVKASQELGEPPLLQPVPTGYPDVASAWAGGSQLLARMDFATRLVAGKVAGVSLPNLDELVPPNLELTELLSRVNRAVFQGLCDERTLGVLREEAARAEPSERRNLLLALALGSPAFQRR